MGRFRHLLREGYEGSPAWLRSAAGTALRRLPPDLRYGSVYARATALIAETEQWSRAQLDAYQAQQLRRVVDHAYGRSPYYRALFDRLGATPADLAEPGAFAQLPLLTRDDVRGSVDRLLADDVSPAERKYVTTGGTGGYPLGFWIDKDSSVIDWAFMVAQWQRAGFRPGDTRAVLRGRVIRGAEQGRTWQHDPLLGELALSSYHLNRATVPEYLRAIGVVGAQFLHAYPSTAIIFAHYIRELGARPPAFRAVLIGSENILDAQRAFLEETFACPVYSWYGHSEKCILAGECEVSRAYHVFPQYGLAEIVDEAGKPITEPGVAGMLAGTSFISSAMPMLRYLTDDWAQWSAGECACGRPYARIEKVSGRWSQEALVGRSGTLLTIAALNLHSGVYDRIRQFQFFQETPGHAVLRIVRAASFGEADEETVLREFRQKVGHELTLELEFVDAIAQTARGKYKFVEQRLVLDAPFMERS